MSADSLSMIMAASGGTAVAAAYQPPPSPPLHRDVLGHIPRNSIVTGDNVTPLLMYPDDDYRFCQPTRRLYNRKSGRKHDQKKTAPTADLKDDMDKYVESPLAVSKFDPSVFLDGYVFDNTPTYGQEVSEQPFWSNLDEKRESDKVQKKSRQNKATAPQNDCNWLQNDDCFWSKSAQKDNDYWSQNEGYRWPRSVETSPASSVSAVSPIGTSPVWSPPDDTPMDLSGLSALFQSLRPTF